MAKARKQKLKVFRTPIGFHDAYVAAPSQKAALEAWGTTTNLFANGAAELVSDPTLTKEPLERPGEVIKRLRGSEEEQIRAAGAAPARAKRRTPANDDERDPPAAKPARRRGPRPSRAKIDKAEKAIEQAERRHRAALAKLKSEEEALDRRRRQAEDAHRKERERLEAALAQARDDYSEALAEWGGD